MDLKGNDVLLFVLILIVPFYLYFNKDGSNMLNKLKLYFGIVDNSSIDLYNRNNDSAISILIIKMLEANQL